MPSSLIYRKQTNPIKKQALRMVCSILATRNTRVEISFPSALPFVAIEW